MRMPATVTELDNLLAEFGKWARVRPEGLYKPPFWGLTPSGWTCYSMTDEEALTIDARLSDFCQRHPDEARAVILHCVFGRTYRQIARRQRTSLSAAYETTCRGLEMLLRRW